MDSVLSVLLQKHIHACQIKTVFKFLFPRLDAIFAQKQMYRDSLLRVAYSCQFSLSPQAAGQMPLQTVLTLPILC